MALNIFSITVFKGGKGCVSWAGLRSENQAELIAFLSGPVANRLHDLEGNAAFEEAIQGLGMTQFGTENIKEVLSVKTPEAPSWAVAESLAEAYLSSAHHVEWPWNTARDKRTPSASLPGADLIGFQKAKGCVRLVLGEVKSSSENIAPPNVMNGQSGMTVQLENLLSKRPLQLQLLKYLLHRCKNDSDRALFNSACKSFFSDGDLDIALFGVLVRDTSPNILDLESPGRKLADKINKPNTCKLIGLYLPFPLSKLPAVVGVDHE